MSGLVGIIAGVIVYAVAKETERPAPVLWALVAWLVVGLVVYEVMAA